MSHKYDMLIELIQITLGTRDNLSRVPSLEEWLELYAIAEKQSVLGICFTGIEKLPKEQNPDIDTLMEWLGQTEYIKTRNEEVNRECREFYQRVTKDMDSHSTCSGQTGSPCNHQACILKGQAVASLYGSLAKYRNSGDIDMWMVEKPEVVIEWARKTGKMYYYDYHHADLSIYDDTEIELHYRPSLSRNLVRNGRLQKWFRKEGKKHIVYNEELGFAVPDYLFSVILTLNHNFWHLLYEGVGMRQTMDLYFVLQSVSPSTGSEPSFIGFQKISEDKAEALKLLKHFNLLDFTAASMWIMKAVFGLEEEYLLCEPDEKRGRFLLDEIMKAGNFGHSDERLNKSRYSKSRIGLMLAWMKHTLRLISQYPADVLWTPIGVMRISLWRRWHYRNEEELKNIK